MFITDVHLQLCNGAQSGCPHSVSELCECVSEHTEEAFACGGVGGNREETGGKAAKWGMWFRGEAQVTVDLEWIWLYLL